MKKRTLLAVEVDSQGRAVLPGKLARRYGLMPGAQVRLEEEASGFRLSRSSENLARIYVEPTNICNLDCVTCMRHVWDEAAGHMSQATFERILEGLQVLQPTPLVFFGGFGEPLTHPHLCEWVAQAHQAGAATELITNGILLTEDTARRLIAAGLDRLWVSLDGATPESYADVRLGSALPEVLANLGRFSQLCGELRGPAGTAPRLGIAFVAMKRNIGDLPALLRLGKSLGADRFSITHVLPHTPELRDEMLYRPSASSGDHLPSSQTPQIDLPRIEMSALTGSRLAQVLQEPHHLSIARQEIHNSARACPFVEKGSVSVRWDGAVSPCLPLLHSHHSYLDQHIRKSHAFALGNLNEHALVALWNSPPYRALRERLLQFDFSPCVSCNSCEMADSNQEDCFGNLLPTCGGCLWAQGWIQCP